MKKIDLSEDDRKNIEWKITKSACMSMGSFVISVIPYGLVFKLASSYRNGLHVASDILFWCWFVICPVIYVFTHPDYIEAVRDTLPSLQVFRSSEEVFKSNGENAETNI